MADSADLLRLTERDARPRRAYWLCGEVVLREEAIDLIRAKVEALPEDAVTVSGTNPTETWDAVNAYGLDASRRRLVVVRDAEKLNLAPLHEWVESRAMPNTHVVLASSWRSWEPTSWRKGDDPHRPADRELFASASRSTTLLVTATISDTEAGAARAADIIQAWAPNLQPGQAERIYDRVMGDMTGARDAARKVAAFRAPMPTRMVDVLTTPRPDVAYTDHLLALQKDRAAEAATHVEQEDVGKVIGLLDWNLDMLGRVHRTLRADDSPYILAARMGVSRHIVQRLMPVAKHYGGREVMRRTSVLAQIDAAHVRGRDSQGLLEVLAALW